MSTKDKITCRCEACIVAMLPQSYINKWRSSQLAKPDKSYINSASTRIFQGSKIDFIEYKNHIFPDNSHIPLRACDTASSKHFPSPITVSKITKWDRILNCCSYFLRTNAPYLESSEQLNRFFLDSLHKIKIHIFQKYIKI